MAFFQNNFWGEKNAGFDVLYHNMKHGQLATKELAEFVRERAAVEETYSKSMSKLAKMASNGSPQGTFAPMWDVFRVSSDKLALCHLELMKKLNDLIRDINKYGDEQVKIHRKTKEEMVGTVEAVQALQVQSGHLQKSKEGYHAKCLELDRLRKEGAPQKELEKGLPQQIICLHLTLSLASSSVTPTLCMTSFTTSMSLLCGLHLFLLTGRTIFNIICLLYPHALSSEHVQPISALPL